MPGKRIILMYISEVSGHHSAAVAIERAIKTLSPGAEILNINAFNYTNPISEKIINRLYLNVIKRMPKIWDYLYDNPDVIKKIEGIKDAIHKFNSPKLKKLFDRFKPDAVVCAQAFPCGMVADFKKTYNSTLPLIAILTDYIPHSYWIYDAVDYYITPSDEVSWRLVKKGVSPEKVRAFGIPIDPKFGEEIKKHEIFQKLNLKPNLPIALIMGGGQGLGPLKTIIKSLDKFEKRIQEIVVAGTNKKLFNSIKKKLKKYKNRVLLLGYVDNVNELMGISDFIITKPGGLTTAEALAKALPMIIIRPIPGQEVSNTAYLTGKKAAIKIDKAKDAVAVIKDFLANPAKLRSMSESAARIRKPNSSLNIARFILSQCRNYATCKG